MSNQFANSFLGGAILGAVEFGIGGFGSGFGAALASGSSFNTALSYGAMGAASGAVAGAIIEGSYMAGWQNKAHGLSKDKIAAARVKNANATTKQQESKILPEDVIDTANDYYDAVGKNKALSNSLTVAKSVVKPTGVFEMVGGIVGGGIGGIIGFGAGLLSGQPGGAVTLALAGADMGSQWGANFGRRFDYPGAGQLNYNEWEGYVENK